MKANATLDRQVSLDRPLPIADKTSFRARALLVGERIDVRASTSDERLATQPLMVAVKGGGLAALFRYGVVVLFDVPKSVEALFLNRIESSIEEPHEPETEELFVRIDPDAREGVDGDTAYLHHADVERLQLVATVLSKSVVLAEYESRVANSFDRIEPLAANLESHGRGGRDARRLLKHMGRALLSQHRMVGRVEMRDKPELLWEHPNLEPLYMRLEDELEIRERYSILERKLDLISRTASTVLELLHTRRGLRLEWYIVILILVEVVLVVYDLFLRGT